MAGIKAGTVFLDVKPEVKGFERDLQKQLAPIAASTEKRLAASFQRSARNLQKFGKTLTLGLTAPLIGLGAVSIKAAIKFESAFAGVRKTVNATEPQFKKLEQGIRDMAKQLPASATSIAHVAEAAGQLGIRTDAILGFTRVMIDLGETTNLTADEAATALARIANIVQLPQDQFDRLGSTIVALGNAGASTEKEIVDMSLRIAGAGHTIGLTVDQTLSFANALSSVGIEAEAGGSAISKLFIKLASSVATPGKELDKFAKVAGLSAKQFTTAFKTDAAGAVVTFIEGLGKLQKAGGNVFGVLDELGLNEVRVRDALLRAAGAGDLFRESLTLGARAWKENSALTEEAAKRYKTTASQLAILRNNVTDVGITLGRALLPVLQSFVNISRPIVGFIANMIEGFAHLPGPIRNTVLLFAGLAAAVGPVIFAVGKLSQVFGPGGTFRTGLTAIGKFIDIFKGKIGGIGTGITSLGSKIAGLGSSIGGVAGPIGASLGNLGGFVGFLAGAIGPATLAAGAVVGLAVAMRQFAGDTQDAKKAAGQFIDSLKGTPDPVQKLKDQIAALEQEANAIEDLTGKPSYLEGFARKLFNADTEAGKLRSQAKELGKSLGPIEAEAKHAAEGLGETFRATALFNQQLEALVRRGLPKQLADQLKGMGVEGQKAVADLDTGNEQQLQKFIADWAAAGNSISGTGEEIRRTFAGLSGDELSKWRDGTIDAINGVDDVLEELASQSKLTAKQVLKSFEQQVKAQVNYRKNFEKLVARDLPDDLLKQIQEMGIKGAGLVAALAGANTRDFDRIIADWKRSQAESRRTADAFEVIPAVLEKIRSIKKVTPQVVAELSGLINNHKASFDQVKQAILNMRDLSPKIRKDLIAKLTAELKVKFRVPIVIFKPRVTAGSGIELLPSFGRLIASHAGGLIPGKGDVPRILEGGEFVMQTAAVKALGVPLLEALNRAGERNARTQLAALSSRFGNQQLVTPRIQIPALPAGGDTWNIVVNNPKPESLALTLPAARRRAELMRARG